MTLRALANLSGRVTADKGDDVSRHPAEVLNELIARGLVGDDGITLPHERLPSAEPAPKPKPKPKAARKPKV